VVSAGQWSGCCRGFRKLVIQALNFSVLFGQLLLGGELVLRKLLGKRGKVLLKSGGLCLLLSVRHR
jgi:hypothetical protein